jgi:hypothetical protein
MKTFKQLVEYLAESNRQDLYHGTSPDAVHQILRDGHIKPSDNGRVSVSRSNKYSTDWSKISNHHHAVIVLNGNSLRHNHQVRPTDFDHHGGSYDKRRFLDGMEPSLGAGRTESEESVKGHIPLKHVKEIRLHRDYYNQFTNKKMTKSEKEIRKEDPKREHWLYRGLHHEDRMKEVKEFHANLKKHNIKLTLEH